MCGRTKQNGSGTELERSRFVIALRGCVGEQSRTEAEQSAERFCDSFGIMCERTKQNGTGTERDAGVL